VRITRKNLGGASEPRPGPSTFDPFSRRPPSCIDIERTSTHDNLASSRRNANPPRSQRSAGATRPNSWQRSANVSLLAGDTTAIYRQPSDHHRSATHQELGVSRISFRCLGCISAHFATGVENVKQHSSLFFCAKESACIFPLELFPFAGSRPRLAMTARPDCARDAGLFPSVGGTGAHEHAAFFRRLNASNSMRPLKAVRRVE
jgi:hypothetical protein